MMMMMMTMTVVVVVECCYAVPSIFVDLEIGWEERGGKNF